MKTPAIAVGLSAFALAAVPGSAHNFACDPETRTYVGDFQHLGPVTFTENADGTITATWAGDGFTRTKDQDPRCAGPTPAPEPETPEEQPKPTTPTTPVYRGPETPVVPLTCADLRARWPKAGKVRQESWGCPANPRKAPTTTRTVRRTRTVVACRWLPNGTVRRGRVVTKTTVTYRTNGRITQRGTVTRVFINRRGCTYKAVTG